MLKIVHYKRPARTGRPPANPAQIVVSHAPDEIPPSIISDYDHTTGDLTLLFADIAYPDQAWTLTLSLGTVESLLKLWHDPPLELMEDITRAKLSGAHDQLIAARNTRANEDVAVLVGKVTAPGAIDLKGHPMLIELERIQKERAKRGT